MAEQNGSTIAEVPLVFGELSGREKMPVSNGTGKDLTVSVEQIARYSLPTGTTTAEFSISDDLGHEILRLEGGHIRTKNFDSSNIKENKDGVEEAPQNGGKFVRQNGKWVPESNGGGGIPDAPKTGSIYGRQNGNWVIVPTSSGGGGGIPDCPMGGDSYLRVHGSWIKYVPPVPSGGSDGGRQVNKFFRNKTYVAFGTSITAGADNWPTHVARYFGLNLINHAMGGSDAHEPNGSIFRNRKEGEPFHEEWGETATRVIKDIPKDTMLVTIAFGANTWQYTSDPLSRNTATSVGAINCLIDKVRATCPRAIIFVASDISHDFAGDQSYRVLKQMAQKRRLYFVEMYNVNSWDGEKPKSNNPELSPDGLHYTEYGKTRIAALWISEISKYLLMGGAEM